MEESLKERGFEASPMSYGPAIAGICYIKILEILGSLPHVKPTTYEVLKFIF